MVLEKKSMVLTGFQENSNPCSELLRRKQRGRKTRNTIIYFILWASRHKAGLLQIKIDGLGRGKLKTKLYQIHLKGEVLISKSLLSASFKESCQLPCSGLVPSSKPCCSLPAPSKPSDPAKYTWSLIIFSVVTIHQPGLRLVEFSFKKYRNANSEHSDLSQLHMSSKVYISLSSFLSYHETDCLYECLTKELMQQTELVCQLLMSLTMLLLSATCSFSQPNAMKR